MFLKVLSSKRLRIGKMQKYDFTFTAKGRREEEEEEEKRKRRDIQSVREIENGK